MSSKRRKWVIEKIANKARRNIDILPSEFQEEVIKRIDRPEKNTFENDIKKILGKKNWQEELL